MEKKYDLEDRFVNLAADLLCLVKNYQTILSACIIAINI